MAVQPAAMRKLPGILRLAIPVAIGLCAAACQPAGPPRMVVAVPPTPQPFCTRTLGQAECFANPATLPDHPTPLGDTPVRILPAPHPWWTLTLPSTP
jgi:hypothetical protein